MKRFLVLIASIYLSLGSHCHAQSDVHMRLLGKGILNQKTGDVIALACIGKEPFATISSPPGCGLVQHVLVVKDTQEVKFVGRTYFFSKNSDPSKKEIKLLVKKLKHGYTGFLSDQSCNVGRNAADEELFGMAAATFSGLVALTFPIVIPIFATGTFFMLKGYFRMNPPAYQGAIIVDAFTNQKGWNWADSAKPVRSKTFNYFLNWVLSQQQPCHQYGCYDSLLKEETYHR